MNRESTERSNRKRLLGIDYGSARIGIAVSDPLRIIAQGVTVLPNSPQLTRQIQALVEEYDVETIVVGYPMTLRGTRGPKGHEVDLFIEQLRRTISCPIVTMDERFTSKSSAEMLRMMGVQKKNRQKKGIVDVMAAALILQTYLDSHKVHTDEVS